MLYILHGPDDYSRSEKIAALKATLGDPATADINITALEGRNLTLSEIQHHASAMPFLSNKRLVMITNYLSQLGRKAKDVQPLLNYVSQLPPTTDLVFVEKESLDKRHPMLKADGAEVVQFTGPTKKALPKWITTRTQQAGGQIQPDAADLLARLVGTNLRSLVSEIEKLLLYTAMERPITRQDVELLVPYTEDAEDFGLSNAIGQRNASRAYDQCRKLLDEGRHPMQILASITTQIRGLLEVKDMAERGLNAAAIAQEKGWRSDYAAKARLRDARNFTMSRLEQTLDSLLKTDLAIKTGRMEAGLALDMLIGQLCQSR